MLQTGSPRHSERQRPRSVSPLTSHHVSTSSFTSTPRLPLLDGPLRNWDDPTLSPGLRRSRSSPHLDMAIKPTRFSQSGYQDSEPTATTPLECVDDVQKVGQESIEDPSRGRLRREPPAERLFSLSRLSESLRFERDQRQQCIHLQDQLRKAHVVAARTARLLHVARSVQRTLGECIIAEDKHSFVNLYNAFQDAVSGCLDIPAATDPSVLSGAKDAINYPASFVDGLPDTSRATLLDFISKVKCDAGFIADHLGRLTPHELVKLLPGKGQSKSSESIFGGSSRTSSRTSRHLGFVADGQTELLTSLEYGSTLDALVHAPRGLSDVPLFRDSHTTGVWSSVCATLIKDQRQGSEKFVPALIDMWAASSPWRGKERLALWTSEILQKGSALLEQASRQSFRVRAGGLADQDTQDENRAEAFYSGSVVSFLTILADSDGPSVIPEGARMFCHAVCKKLEPFPSHRLAFANFVLIRWLSASFLTDAVTSPEVNGILRDHFVSDNARQRILRETANRCQKAIFDVVYSWRLGQKASPELSSIVQSLARRFEPSPSQALSDPVCADADWTQLRDNSVSIPLCAADVRYLVNALYPQRSYGSSTSESDGSRTGLQSSSSSISGFSLFQSPAASMAMFTSSPQGHDSLAGQQLPSLTSLNRDFPFDSEKVEADHDGDVLREICNALDDGFAGRTLSDYPDWAVLLYRPSSQELCTIRDALSRDLASTLTTTRGLNEVTDVTPGLHRCCEAIREVLLTAMLTSQPDEHLRYQMVVQHILLSFDAEIAMCEENSDFVAAHMWFRRRQDFEIYRAAHPEPESLYQILDGIGSLSEQALDTVLATAHWYLEPIHGLHHSLEMQYRDLLAYADIASHQRMKMWYVAEVRTSAAYDEARSVAAALKVMGKSKRPRRTRPSLPLRHWNGSRISSTSFHLKTEAQVLEILSALPDHGGPNKLSDDQARALTNWLSRNGIENLCSGEERLQRLCMEIQKAVSTLTADASTAWSSSLFARDQLSGSTSSKSNPSSPLWPYHGYTTRFDPLTLHTSVSPSIDSISSAASHPLSARSSRDYLDTRSPALTNKSSTAFWSPAMTETRSPSSATSVGSSHTRAPGRYLLRPVSAPNSQHKEILKEEIRQHVISLLLSDLSLTTFANGSETDQAFWAGLGGDLVEKRLRVGQDIPRSCCGSRAHRVFDLNKASGKVMRLFTATSNPFTKLRYLCDLDTLFRSSALAAQVESLPGAMMNGSDDTLRQTNGISPTSQARIYEFRKLFADSRRRPPTIFRDMQYIASFMPPTMTSSTPQGRAFHHAAIALLGIKQEGCRLMMETADSIIDFHSNKRGSGGSASTAQRERDSAAFPAPNRTPPAEDISRYTMAQAAELLQITAKEGDAVAQRELATLYLTDPELMDHIIAPLSRPRDVFKEELESKWRKNLDPSRCDPATMCVAHHWMSLSSKGGDALAKEYLRQREEMERLG